MHNNNNPQSKCMHLGWSFGWSEVVFTYKRLKMEGYIPYIPVPTQKERAERPFLKNLWVKYINFHHQKTISSVESITSWVGQPGNRAYYHVENRLVFDKKNHRPLSLIDINPKRSLIKQRIWHLFEQSYELLGPVRSHWGQKMGPARQCGYDIRPLGNVRRFLPLSVPSRTQENCLVVWS